MEQPNAPDVAPLISVHCITFNHAGFIAAALESFLAQKTTFPVEIVVGEDCSTDGTREIVERYSKRYPKIIRIISSDTNVGAVANFERTLKACRGKYVAICEGDDYWRDPYKLHIQVDFLESHPDYVLAYHDATGFDQNGFDESPQLPAAYRVDADKTDLIRSRPLSTLTVCFRNLIRELPEEVRHSPILDLCMWSLLGWHGKGKFLPQIASAAYRRHTGGIMSMQSEQSRLRMTAQAFLCLSRYYQRIGEIEIADYFLIRACVCTGYSLDTTGKLQAVYAIIENVLYTLFANFRSRLLRVIRPSG